MSPAILLNKNNIDDFLFKSGFFRSKIKKICCPPVRLSGRQQKMGIFRKFNFFLKIFFILDLKNPIFFGDLTENSWIGLIFLKKV